MCYGQATAVTYTSHVYRLSPSLLFLGCSFVTQSIKHTVETIYLLKSLTAELTLRWLKLFMKGTKCLFFLKLVCYFGIVHDKNFTVKWTFPQWGADRIRNGAGCYGPPPPQFSSCLLSVEKLQAKNNRRSEKMQKWRKTVKGDHIIMVLSLSIVKDL